MKQKFGYVRVSTKDQKIDRQINAMKPLNIPKGNVYVDYFSGQDFKRPAYQKMLKRLRAKDELYVKSIDRLGRNYEEIIQQWRYLSKDIGVDIIVLDMPLLDTRSRSETNLTGTFISDIVLQILSYVAQTERENTRQRQAEGIAAARAKGIHCGRPELQLPKNFSDIVSAYRRKELTGPEAAQLSKMGYATFYRKIKDF